jgi:hypothetical protein
MTPVDAASKLMSLGSCGLFLLALVFTLGVCQPIVCHPNTAQTATASNRRRVGDATKFVISEAARCILAVILDLFSRYDNLVASCLSGCFS